jgi:hypothetical protein
VVAVTALDAKLADFDRHADGAVRYLAAWLDEHAAALITMARGRLVEGHYRYRDRLMYEYSNDELLAEAAQELADAINYVALRQTRELAGDSTSVASSRSRIPSSAPNGDIRNESS